MHLNPYVRFRPELPWPPPSCDKDKRHTRVIADKIWSLDQFKTIAAKCIAGTPNSIIAITKNCEDDMQNHMLRYEDVADIIGLLTDDDYENSLWCMRSKRNGTQCAPESLWMPCDSYVIEIELEDEPDESITYYLKMCQNITGTVLLMISTHPSEYDH